MSDITELLTGVINYLQAAPAVVLVVVALNLLGLVLKKTPLPNVLIPWVLIAVGILLTTMLAPLPEGRNPVLRLAVLGFLFACLAWLFHAALLRRLERFLPAFLRPEDEDKLQPPTP